MYTAPESGGKYITPAFRYDKWIAHYADACGIADYDVWQASNTGRIPGINGNVDIDYMATDYRNIIFPYGFVQKEDGIYFYDNYRLQFGWIDVAGLRFHMNPAALGRMDTGWFTDETGVYYLNQGTGHALVGQNIIDNAGYMFDEKGAMLSGWQNVNGLRYYYNPLDGNRMHTGWLADETGMHYLIPEGGYMATGAVAIEDKIYLFSPEGNMQVGWQDVEGLRFYYSPQDGALVTGWFTDETGRYYLTPLGGYMVTGLQAVEDQLYYFNEEGQMQLGLQNIQGLNFYFDLLTGAMTTGWILTPSGSLYFSEVDGHMLMNEIAMVDGMPRCFAEDGTMVVNGTYTIGGITYFCDANGYIIFAQ